MAQQYQTEEGVLIVPGAYGQAKVQNSPSGLGVRGVLCFIGEASAGVAFDEESELVSFAPDQLDEVRAKYGSGPLVDAFAGAITPSADDQVNGTFTSAFLLKTNVSTRSSITIPKIGGGTYGELQAVLGGVAGNTITRRITLDTAESPPSTGNFVLAVPQVNTDVEFRVNGGSALTVNITAGNLPHVIVGAINSLAGVAATGGADLSLITGSNGLQMVHVTGRYCTLQKTSGTWNNTPPVGSLVYIPTGSIFALANEGSYIVTGATATSLSLYKLIDAAGTGNSVTNPTNETVTATPSDIQAYGHVTISLEATLPLLPGRGKTLEIANTTVGSFDHIAWVASAPGSAVPATWVSKSASPYALSSVAEYAVNLNIARQADAFNEEIIVQAAPALLISYRGTTASVNIANGVLATTVTGGPGTSHTIQLRDYPTISELASYINTLTGYKAAPASAAEGQRSSLLLDPGTYTMASTHGAYTCRIHRDGARFVEAVNTSQPLVTLVATAPAGLPDVVGLGFFSGGTRGATTQARITAAFEAAEGIKVNFVVPLFSRSSAADIVDGLTDPASSYDINAIHATARSHALKTATRKARRRRQVFLSIRDTYAVAKEVAGNMATSRVNVSWQDVRTTDALGNIRQFHPWMAAVKAAAFQAAAGYRAIFAKTINISGAIVPYNDWDQTKLSNQEDAIKAGLLTIVNDPSIGPQWISDQTSYSKDDNFVYNSIQAVYAVDVIISTAETRFERAFVGQSVADVSASGALQVLELTFEELKRLKWVASSDDAPNGYRNAKVKIRGTAMPVSAEVKVAGAIYFVPIDFLFTPVVQSA